MLQGQVGVGQGLGLHALGGVHHQHRALTGGQGPGHLIVEVHVARGVDEIQGVGLPVGGLVVQPHRPGLDGDAPLPLQVHVVQQLGLHFPLGDGVAQLDEAVGKGGFSVVNVDATLVAQAPKIKSYKVAMAERLSGALGVNAEQVNVKATTEEGLGFTGDGTGMAAHAEALLEKQE